MLLGWKVSPDASALRLSPTPLPANVTNTVALGRLIYTDYVFLFQAAGLVLLVAMIGAIVLTLRDRKTSRHQDIAVQTGRVVARSLTSVTMRLGQGIAAGDILRPLDTQPGTIDKDPLAAPEPAHAGDHH